jgi:hypothetical protein
MKIPVFVQPPNKPNKGAVVGRADSDLDAAVVAKLVGVPKDCFITGKVIRSKKQGDYWSIVAYVEIDGGTTINREPRVGPMIVSLPLTPDEQKLVTDAAMRANMSLRQWLRAVAVSCATNTPTRFVDEDGVVYPPPASPA